MSSAVPNPRYTLPDVISDKAQAAAKQAVDALPPRMRTELMHELMLACLYDSDFRQAFRADPRGVCASMDTDLELSRSTKLDVHENDTTTVHLVLPGVDIRLAREKGEEELPRVSLTAYEARARGEEVLEISDDDLMSGPVIAILEDDIMDPDSKGDRKGDAGYDGNDGTGNVLDDNDSDTPDTGRDPL